MEMSQGGPVSAQSITKVMTKKSLNCGTVRRVERA